MEDAAETFCWNSKRTSESSKTTYLRTEAVAVRTKRKVKEVEKTGITITMITGVAAAAMMETTVAVKVVKEATGVAVKAVKGATGVEVAETKAAAKAERKEVETEMAARVATTTGVGTTRITTTLMVTGTITTTPETEAGTMAMVVTGTKTIILTLAQVLAVTTSPLTQVGTRTLTRVVTSRTKTTLRAGATRTGTQEGVHTNLMAQENKVIWVHLSKDSMGSCALYRPRRVPTS